MQASQSVPGPTQPDAEERVAVLALRQFDERRLGRLVLLTARRALNRLCPELEDMGCEITQGTRGPVGGCGK